MKSNQHSTAPARKKKRQRNDGLRKVCGCPRRSWTNSCRHPWHFNLRWQGEEYRFSLERCIGRLVRGETSAKGRPVWTRDTTSLGEWISDKTSARIEADRLRVEIQNGTFKKEAPAPSVELTLRDVVEQYLKRHVQIPTRRKTAQRLMELHLARLCAEHVPAAGGTTMALGDKPVDGPSRIVKADVDALRDQHRAGYAKTAATVAAFEVWQQLSDEDRQRAPRPIEPPRTKRPGVKGGEIGIKRMLARLRHVFSWAIVEGYATSTPFRRHGVTVVKLKADESPRTRRLEPGEEERLRAAAQPHLRALVVAALTTGCRLGELLSLQWRDIRHDDHGPRWIMLTADRTKTSQNRTIPIGPKLRAELEMRRTDPAGALHGPEAHVFGNELGEPIGSIKTAWRATCGRAGITGLHFHDLRREFGSRLLESGADMHDVREFLGHAQLTTTSRYLASTPLRLERALHRMEELATPLIDTSTDNRCNPVANEATDAVDTTDRPTTVN